jgi:chemotaxis protein MotB
MAKKKHHEEHENHERWLVSYADFITLLFAFFVVMYSVSRVDNKKLSQAANAIKWALHYGGTGGVAQMPIFDGPASETGAAVDMQGGPLAPPRSVIGENIRRDLENRLAPFLLAQRTGPAAVSIVVEGDRVTVRLAAADFFDPGQAVLRPQILPVLDAIAGELVPLHRPLRIEGHTDDTPVAGSRFRDNWELSAVRAATVVSYLERAHRAAPELLTAMGLAATRPITTGDSPEARELNRRVEMILELDLKTDQKARVQPRSFEPIPKAP